MYYITQGSPENPSIVFIHGTGVGGWMWQSNIQELVNYHCILVDLPGHGNSNDQEWISLADSAKQISEIIRAHTKERKAHIVGASLGGSVAFSLLCIDPEVVDHVLISGTSLLPMPGGMFFKAMIRLIAPIMKKDIVLRTAFKALNLSEEGFAQFKQAMMTVSRKTFVNAFTEALNQRYSTELEKVTQPILLISGENEPSYIRKSNEMLERRLINVKAKIVQGMGHGWMGESTRLFTNVMTKWLHNEELPKELT